MQCGGGGALVEGSSRLLLQPVQIGYLQRHRHTIGTKTLNSPSHVLNKVLRVRPFTQILGLDVVASSSRCLYLDVWMIRRESTIKATYSHLSHLIAPSAQLVETHGVIISEGNGTVQMLLSGEKKNYALHNVHNNKTKTD